MLYNFNGKTINIPNDEIKKNMEILKISQEEAVQMYLEDEGYLENEEVEALTEKAKINKINHEAKAVKPRKATTRKPKPDAEKEKIIEILSKTLENEGFLVKITNKTKLIEFDIDGNHYKLDLIRQRMPKN